MPVRSLPSRNFDLALVQDSTDYGGIETVHLGIVHALAAALRGPDPERPDPTHGEGASVGASAQ